MRMAHELCLATAGKQVPDGPHCVHEVKHDSYRMLVIREDDRVRLLSRNGTNWTRRYPWIAEAALKNRQKHFVVDGEAVILGLDGVSDFNALHSRKHDQEAQLYAFDVLAMGGDDPHDLPLHQRKTKLERLLARRPDGITVAPFERGEIGPDLFRAACRMGLEGLVSKHRDRPYRGGRQKHWIEVGATTKRNPPEGGWRKVQQWVCKYQSAAHISAVLFCERGLAMPTVSWLGSAEASTIIAFGCGVRSAI